MALPAFFYLNNVTDLTNILFNVAILFINVTPLLIVMKIVAIKCIS